MKKGNPCALLLEMQIGAATVESSVELPQLKMDLTFDPAILLLGIYPKEAKTLKEHKYPYVHCSITYNHQDTDAAQVSISR